MAELKIKKMHLYLIVGLISATIIFAVYFLANRTESSIESSSAKLAPDFQITLTNGTAVRLSDFKGHPVLLWFVATWCPSCQYGAQLLSQQYYPLFRSKGVTILTIELYNNLGQSGPSISQFAELYGNGVKDNWLYGTSDRDTTYTYDPQAYLDIYYAIDSTGKIITSGVGLPNNLNSLVSVF